MRRLTFLVVLVAFVFSCGGQWCVLQGIAWANMIREYSAVVPLTQAVTMTLSGQYPCAICKLIAERKNTDNGKIATLQKQEKKILAAAAAAPASPVQIAPQTFLLRQSFFSSRSEPPPAPPPRLA